ncbi:hypothetical protein NL521_28595, partial [Klebsiella pneumoniae]|nr:hypothetical protein [Klebsiella pneumoniae]
AKVLNCCRRKQNTIPIPDIARPAASFTPVLGAPALANTAANWFNLSDWTLCTQVAANLSNPSIL